MKLLSLFVLMFSVSSSQAATVWCNPKVEPAYRALPSMEILGTGVYYCSVPASACMVSESEFKVVPATEDVRCKPVGPHLCPDADYCARNNGGKDGNWFQEWTQESIRSPILDVNNRYCGQIYWSLKKGLAVTDSQIRRCLSADIRYCLAAKATQRGLIKDPCIGPDADYAKDPVEFKTCHSQSHNSGGQFNYAKSCNWHPFEKQCRCHIFDDGGG